MTDIPYFSSSDARPGFAGAPVGFGGATPASAMPWLASEGFASVVNLRAEGEEGAEVPACRAAAEAAGLTYIHLPIVPSDMGPGVIDEVLAAVGNRENQPVYIHCATATRVGAVWMIGRVLKDGWGMEEARVEAETIAGKPEQAVAFANQYLAARGE